MKKSVSYYMNLQHRMVVLPESDEGGYTVMYPDLPGCISSGDDIADAVKNAQDAKRCWLEAAIEDDVPIKEPRADEEYSGQFKLRIPKSLHRSLSEHAQEEGISMNQYCLYLLSMNDARYPHRMG